MGNFDTYLSVSLEELDFELRSIHHIPWIDFWLNPRRLRGSDFLMRWSQGVWSERRIIEAVNQTSLFFALEYGPSSTAPEHNIREFELYFELLDAAGLGDTKRPDLLIFKKADHDKVDKLINSLAQIDVFHNLEKEDNYSYFNGLKYTQKLPFISEDEMLMKDLLSLAVIAVECENSLWVARQMPSFKEKLRPMKRLCGKLGLPKNAVLPTIIIKEEDRAPLLKWQHETGINVHIWHVFYDLAYGLSLNEAEKLISEGLIEGNTQTFQAPAGATTKKQFINSIITMDI